MSKIEIRMKPLVSFALLLSILCSSKALGQETWVIQEDYRIAFSGTKAEGTFRGLTGIILFDPSNLEASTFDVSVDPSTISTGNKTKDKHARGDSWFDVITYPSIQFSSSQITRGDNGEFTARGDLQIKGISKEITILFRFTRNLDSGTFSGTMLVNREDFGIEGNFFGFVVGEDFELELSIPVRLEKD